MGAKLLAVDSTEKTMCYIGYIKTIECATEEMDNTALFHPAKSPQPLNSNMELMCACLWVFQIH